ncbi:MAG: aminotransferase class I/II-fold pyridoxal phosphate-dependent enzyme [Ilumatobacteraceae bacterium]
MTALDASARASRVPPFHAMAMGRAASAREAAGHRVLHLEIGQPSTGAPRLAVDAVTAALGRPLGYTDADGLVTLRRRIARHHLDERGVTVDADRIVAVAGASAGFTLAFLAAFDAGARVGVVEPGYPCYRNTLHALDMEPVPIAVGADTRWAPTPAMLDAVGPLDGLIVASPSNPTGTILDAATLDELIAHCDARGIRLVADEIYHGITYGPVPAPTVLGRTTDAIVINSFSKYFSMTGWRIGWVVAPDPLVDAFVRLQQNLYVCAAHVSQIAATAAMDASAELDAHVARYATNRAILLDGLAGAGLTDIAEPDGAFYVYADVGDLVDRLGDPTGSMALCRRWLDEIGVACTPGIDFDLARGDRFVRFSYAGATDDVGEACALIADWIGRHP